MNKLSLGLILVLFALSASSFASDTSRDALYNACLPVETKHAAADGQSDPKPAAHYLCTIFANTCTKRPDEQGCSEAHRQYGLVK